MSDPKMIDLAQMVMASMEKFASLNNIDEAGSS
jgi:hypothetical protein